MKNLLITGYEPFGGDSYNPSLELAIQLAGKEYKGYRFVYAKIPVNRGKCIPAVAQALKDFQPEIVLCTGLAWGRARLAVERVAINVADFPVPDNEGYLALNEKIAPLGPAAYFSTLPIRAMVKAMNDKGYPAYVSNTAGTYCCNLLMYGVLHHFATEAIAGRAGMMHVPFETKQVALRGEDIPSMTQNAITAAVEVAAEAIIDNEKDIELICGAVN